MSTGQRITPRAFNFLVHSALPELLKRWDGGTERLGLFLESNEATVVGFCARAYAIRLLEGLLSGLQVKRVRPTELRYGGAMHIAEVLELLRKEPSAGCLQFLVLGWGGCWLYEVEAASLHEVARKSLVAEAEALLADACDTAEGAGRLVHIARVELEVGGRRAVELELLELAIATQWEEIAAMTLAISRAQAGLARLVTKHEGHQAQRLLGVLARQVALRSVKRLNALGGSA